MKKDGNGKKGSIWFIETKRFTSSWDSLNLKVEDLLSLQDTIKSDPTSYPVISGTGGLRKLRFAPRSRRTGKRGSLRVCFAHVPKFAVVVLVLVFEKSDQATLAADDKKNVQKWLKELDQELERRFKRRTKTT